MSAFTTSDSTKKAKNRLRFPFGVKLALIVTLILLGSIWTITLLMELTVSAEFARTAEISNFDLNGRAAAGLRERLNKVRSEALLLLDINDSAGDNVAMARQARNIFFERNPDIAAVIVPGVLEIANNQFFAVNEIPPEITDVFLASVTDIVERAKNGEPVIMNASPGFGLNILALFYPWQNTGYENAAVVLFSPENISEITGFGANSTVVANGNGDILIHPDFNQVLEGANLAGSPLFDALRKSAGESVRLSYSEGGNRFVGAGHRISFADAAVFSSLEYSLVTGQITAVTRRNMLLSVTVMFLTVLVTWFFSRTVTAPLRKLMAAISQLESGEFILDLKPASTDEIGMLTGRMAEAGLALGKREEAKRLFGRYGDDGITGRAMAGELDLGARYLEAVIACADFILPPANSGNPDAAEDLNLLNFFIRKMSYCVEKTGGAAEAVTGGKIIAHWGVFPAGETGETGDRVMNAVRSALMMRAALWELNTDREKEGLAPLRVSCGIHAGQVLAGCIGTEKATAYSVAGSAVTQAVIACGECVPLQTDIMITGAAREIAGDRIIAEELQPSRPGNEGLLIFALVNASPSGGQEMHWPFTLDDVRESLRGRRNSV